MAGRNTLNAKSLNYIGTGWVLGYVFFDDKPYVSPVVRHLSLCILHIQADCFGFYLQELLRKQKAFRVECELKTSQNFCMFIYGQTQIMQKFRKLL